MGAASEFYSELNKLKKEMLIDIILKKCIPEGLNLSRELKKFLNKNSESEFFDASCEVQPNLDSTNVEVVRLESEIKILQTEVKCSKVLISTLEKTVVDKEEIILLLKNRKANPSNQSTVAGLPQQFPGKRSIERVSLVGGNISGVSSQGSQITQKPSVTGSREPIIVGDMEACDKSQPLGFVGAARKAWLYVGRADRSTTAGQVEQHLKGRFSGQDFVVERLPVRDNANSIAFRVGADISLMDDLNKPSLWPKGIVVKRYRFFRPRSGIPQR